MMLDGLEDAYEEGRSMGTFGEDCAAKYHFSRADQDAYALESVKRAQAATNDGSFKWEIVPVTVKGRAGETVIDKDEGPVKAKPEKIASLKPAFKKDGTITAASSSSINDGAAALVLMRQSTADKMGLKPLAKILGHATNSQEPDVKSFKAVAEKRESEKAAIAVTLTGRAAKAPMPADRTMRFDLGRDAGQWKIDDIRGDSDGEPWSIRYMLESPLKN